MHAHEGTDVAIRPLVIIGVGLVIFLVATCVFLVFLFDHPTPGPASQPLTGPQIIQKNGSTVTFKDVSTSPVYIVAVYDEQGGYSGVGGPPPDGTPIGTYSKDPKSPPAPVTPGPKTVLKMSFSDAKRFGK